MFIVEATFDYSDDANGKLRLRVYPGISGYKSARPYDTDSETRLKLGLLNKKSTTCYIDKEGYVYTKEEGEEIKLRNEDTSTKSEVNN